MARKRKALQQGWRDAYDSEEIQVASSPSKRAALHIVSVPNAQNKRRRVLDSVLIPVNRETRKLIQDAQYFTSGAKKHQSTPSRTPSESDVGILPEQASSRGPNTQPLQRQTEHAPRDRAKHSMQAAVRDQDDLAHGYLQIISALRADKRWGLSGTPAVSDFYDVAQIGKLLNIPLRIPASQRGVMKQRNIRKLQDQMTSFERFEAARAAPSYSQNGRIQELGQIFLDTFTRRNLMDFDQMLVHQHLVPVSLSLQHHAMYHELSQHLNSSDMKIKKSDKSKDTDLQKQLLGATVDAQTAEEALYKSAAYPRRLHPDASSHSVVDDWIHKRESETGELTDRLLQVIRKAFKEEPVEYFNWRGPQIDNNALGDKETVTIVKQICKEVYGGKAASDVAVSKGKKEKGTKADKRKYTSEANKLLNRPLTSRRSARYLRNVHRLQALALHNKNRPVKCDHPECSSKLSSTHPVAVSGLCGHLICNDCFKSQQSNATTACPVDGCNAQMAGHHILWNTKLGNLRGTRHTQHGAEVDAACDILEEIRDNGEQAVLFVQYENQLDEISHALEDRNIPGLMVANTKDAAKQIESFTATNSAYTVLVLNSMDESAAGLNLQNANHVLFLSPLLRDTQYAYDATMAQAIGRVRWRGQERAIHVYRIVALHTIDVDVLEHEERRSDALTERGAEAVRPPEGLRRVDMRASGSGGDEGDQRERTQLVREKGGFSLRPRSWLVKCGAEDEDGNEGRKVVGKNRVRGWEDFSSLVKFSKGFVEDYE